MLYDPQAMCEGELGPAPPFPPMRVLEVQWTRALSLLYTLLLEGCSSLGSPTPTVLRVDKGVPFPVRNCGFHIKGLWALLGSFFMVSNFHRLDLQITTKLVLHYHIYDEASAEIGLKIGLRLI